MKAVVFRRHGGPEVLEYADMPDPHPAADEILVQVKACALNHLDIWVRQGIPAYRIQLPHISGCDVAGVVASCGEEVKGFRTGQRVVLAPGLNCGACEFCRAGHDSLCVSYGIRGARTPGGYAQLTSAKAKDAIPLPENISFETAAAFPLAFLAAWHMLIGRARLNAGETVLVHAAGSGVGHAAVQIAKHHGARVITTVGADEKIAKAKALGANAVVQYRKESVEERIKQLTDGRGVDVVVEHIGPEVWDVSLKALAKGGRLVTCGATSGPQVALDLRYVFSRQLSILGSMMGTRAELNAVAGLVFQGELKPVVDTVFPLSDARAAQERLLSRSFFGKLVLSIS